MPQRRSIPKGRLLRVIGILIAIALAISFITYKQMTLEVPEFAQLEAMSTVGMTYTVTKSRKGNHYIVEFGDESGKRYQTKHVSEDTATQIGKALQSRPVTIHVGPWLSPFTSTVIYSIYHMSAGGRDLIGYDSIARAKEHDRRDVWKVIGMINAVFIVVILFAVSRFQIR